MPVELHLAGGHNVLNALCAAAAATAAGASLDDVRIGACHNAPGSWPIAVQNRAEWCLDRRRLLQRQSQFDEGGDRGAGERGRAALAGHGRHGRARRLRRPPAMKTSAASRAITTSTACSPPASCRRSRSKPSVRAGNGSPTRSRWRARSIPSSRARSACWSRARASNRLERVVDALVGAAFFNEYTLNTCSTGSPNC